VWAEEAILLRGIEGSTHQDPRKLWKQKVLAVHSLGLSLQLQFSRDNVTLKNGQQSVNFSFYKSELDAPEGPCLRHNNSPSVSGEEGGLVAFTAYSSQNTWKQQLFPIVFFGFFYYCEDGKEGWASCGELKDGILGINFHSYFNSWLQLVATKKHTVTVLFFVLSKFCTFFEIDFVILFTLYFLRSMIL
jgi:hypothetical protein